MTRFSVPRSRLADTLTTPGGTDCTADVDASCSAMQQRPDAVVHRVRYDKEETDERSAGHR
jgi:hypothetical protein